MTHKKGRPRPARVEGAAVTGPEQADPTCAPSTDPPPAPVIVHRRIRLSDLRFRLAWSLQDISRATTFSTRLLERLISSGRFPAADVTAGRRRAWKPSTVRAWIEQGGDTNGKP
jgi:hypothetical protein